jgi:hypothetical protein
MSLMIQKIKDRRKQISRIPVKSGKGRVRTMITRHRKIAVSVKPACLIGEPESIIPLSGPMAWNQASCTLAAKLLILFLYPLFEGSLVLIEKGLKKLNDSLSLLKKRQTDSAS